MDILTHGIAVSLLLVAVNAGPFLLPGILGAISPDLDFVFFFIRARDPRRYIFIHGGLTHSLVGGCLAALVAFGAALVVAAAVPAVRETEIVLSAGALVALIAGVLLHLFLDLLAYPGIPLLYPESDRKYTLGIFPGPSMFILGLSLVFLVPFVFGLIGQEAFFWYGVVFLAFVLVSAGIKILVSARTVGRTIPSLNPLVWLVLAESDDSYSLSSYHLIRGSYGDRKDFAKYTGVTPEEASWFRDLSEIKRLFYHSYIVTVERDGQDLVYRDPLRTGGTIFYPPYYAEVRVPRDADADGT